MFPDPSKRCLPLQSSPAPPKCFSGSHKRSVTYKRYLIFKTVARPLKKNLFFDTTKLCLLHLTLPELQKRCLFLKNVLEREKCFSDSQTFTWPIQTFSWQMFLATLWTFAVSYHLMSSNQTRFTAIHKVPALHKRLRSFTKIPGLLKINVFLLINFLPTQRRFLNPNKYVTPGRLVLTALWCLLTAAFIATSVIFWHWRRWESRRDGTIKVCPCSHTLGTAGGGSQEEKKQADIYYRRQQDTNIKKEKKQVDI